MTGESPVQITYKKRKFPKFGFYREGLFPLTLLSSAVNEDRGDFL